MATERRISAARRIADGHSLEGVLRRAVGPARLDEPFLFVLLPAKRTSVSPSATLLRLVRRTRSSLRFVRNMLGRLLRWHIPGRFHTPIAPEEKERLYRERRSFREA